MKILFKLKAQRLQWFGLAMRGGETMAVRTAVVYQPSEKRPRDRPRKRWFYGVSQDLRSLDVEDLSEIIQDMEIWKAVTLLASVIKPKRIKEEETAFLSRTQTVKT